MTQMYDDLMRLFERIVYASGLQLYNVGVQIVQNTGNKQLRAQTIANGRAAIQAVVRLLVLADFIDTNAIADCAEKVTSVLLRNATNAPILGSPPVARNGESRDKRATRATKR